jgi:sugar fermentation stimulation protein A
MPPTTDMSFDFGRIYKCRFLERPNRFLVRVRSRSLGEVEAFMPNPGRMWELLLPGVILYIIRAKETPGKERKTKFTAIAVERDGAPVFLHTHVNNLVAHKLIEDQRISALKGAHIVRAEVPVGRSRFDFLLRDAQGDIYVEVKSCTLFGNQVAMFPDAITDRGRKHLIELAELADQGHRAVVIFVVHTRKAKWFMPDYHTDLAFSRTLLDVHDRVEVLPVSVEWNSDLSLGRSGKLLDIPWDHVDREAHDSGAYFLILHFEEARTITVGRLGEMAVRPGYYIYVGSARTNLEARMVRHKRKRKKFHWHIDYLRAHADAVEALPVRSSQDLECTMADSMARNFTAGPDGFGSSDCDCRAHLFHTRHNPLQDKAFLDLLEQLRMRQPP